MAGCIAGVPHPLESGLKQRWNQINLMSEDGAEVLSSKKVPEMASSFNVFRLPLKIRKALRHLLDFILALFLAATMHRQGFSEGSDSISGLK